MPLPSSSIGTNRNGLTIIEFDQFECESSKPKYCGTGKKKKKKKEVQIHLNIERTIFSCV